MGGGDGLCSQTCGAGEIESARGTSSVPFTGLGRARRGDEPHRDGRVGVSGTTKYEASQGDWKRRMGRGTGGRCQGRRSWSSDSDGRGRWSAREVAARKGFRGKNRQVVQAIFGFCAVPIDGVGGGGGSVWRDMRERGSDSKRRGPATGDGVKREALSRNISPCFPLGRVTRLLGVVGREGGVGLRW